MDIGMLLKVVAALGTAAAGLLALVKPSAIYPLTGLTAPGQRGITEIRAVFGGLFIALGIAPFLLRLPAYRMLGIGYGAVAVVRLISIFIDRSADQSNWINLAIEVVFTIILLT